MGTNYEVIIDELKCVITKYNMEKNIDNIYDNIVFIGIMSELMNNKKIFRRNKDLANFLEDRFGIKFAEYCKKSRPLIVGKTIKFFYGNNEYVDYKENLNKIYKFLHMIINESQNEITWDDIFNKIDL